MSQMRRLLPALLFASACSALGQQPHAGVLGDWQSPDGSVIAIAPCGESVCARLVAVDPKAPGRFDAENPDPALRSRRLCGLEIGREFHLVDPDHATGGKLYDPKSGKTYSGSMSAEGDKLSLRGYVGLKIFGRSEVWTRVKPGFTPCSQ